MSNKNSPTKNQQYCWDLEKILDGGDFDSLVKKDEDLKKEIVDLFNASPFESLEKFKIFNKKQLDLRIVGNKISNYLSNNMNVDLSDTHWFLISQELQHKSIEFAKALATLQEECFKNEDKIQEYLKDPEFSKYTKVYSDLFKYKKHILPPSIKKYGVNFSPLYGSNGEIFSLLYDKELQVEPALDSRGKKHKIPNYSKYQKYLTHKDRELRKNVYINWTTAVHSQRETLSRLMYFNFLERNIHCKTENFSKGFYESEAFDDEIPLSLPTFIYSQVEKWSSQAKQYRKIFSEILKKRYSLDKVQRWDASMPISNDKDFYSIEEAQKITIESLSIFGPEYRKNLEKAFAERWIDWLPRDNKISGAYSIGSTLGIDQKYIFMNYNNKFDDISTLVHELGHSLHSVEFCKTQDIYASTTIFIAEIPSILNEILLNYHFLKKYQKTNNLKKQLEIYDNLISTFLASTSSQIAYSSWEYDLNNLVLAGKGFSADQCESLYLEKIAKYLKTKDKNLNKYQKMDLTKILTVPHFYSDCFYVYKYAIGMVVSVVLAHDLLQADDMQKDKILKKYFDFLSLGCSKSNLEAIETLGYKVDGEELWDKAKKILTSWIKIYSGLYLALYKQQQ